MLLSFLEPSGLVTLIWLSGADLEEFVNCSKVAGAESSCAVNIGWQGGGGVGSNLWDVSESGGGGSRKAAAVVDKWPKTLAAEARAAKLAAAMVAA